MDHDHLDDAEKQAAATRSTVVSAGVNVFLSTLQIAVGLTSGAASLVADGIHSLSDLVSDFAVLFARHYAKQDPDEDHPYGHHRYENAASLFLGLILLSVAAGMIYAALGKIDDHDALKPIGRSAIWVAVLSLVSKELLFRYMLRKATEVKSTLLVANAWHARSDAASSLVAGLGIVGSTLGYSFLDPVAAVVVAFIIGKMGFSFTWDALHDLMDRSVSTEQLQEIRQTILQTPGIQGLHDLRARKMGDLLILDVHLEIDGKLTVREGHDIALHARERVLKQHRVLGVMTHVDPQETP